MSHGKNRGAQRKRARARRLRRLFEQQGGKCFYCKSDMRLVTPAKDAQDACTFDHRRARASGGGGGLKNLVAACHRCNTHKGCKDAAAFAEIAPTLPPPYAAWRAFACAA